MLKIPKNSGKIKHLSFGPLHTAITTHEGHVYTCGSNLYSQLGSCDSNEDYLFTFKMVHGLSDVKMAICGEKHTMALNSKGEIYAWGYGGNFFNVGALGIGVKKSVSSPTKVKLDEEIVSIQAGKSHSLALTKSGHVFSWGTSMYGVLGSMSMDDLMANGISSPREIEYFKKIRVSQIKACDNFNAALTEQGNLYMWGINNKNQLGTEIINMDMNTCETIPLHISQDYKQRPLKIKEIDLCPNRCTALDVNKKFYEWGRNFVYPTSSQDFGSEILKSVGVGTLYAAVITESERFLTWGNKNAIAAHNSAQTPTELDVFKGRKVKKMFTGDNKIAVIVD